MASREDDTRRDMAFVTLAACTILIGLMVLWSLWTGGGC